LQGADSRRRTRSPNHNLNRSRGLNQICYKTVKVRDSDRKQDSKSKAQIYVYMAICMRSRQHYAKDPMPPPPPHSLLCIQTHKNKAGRTPILQFPLPRSKRTTNSNSNSKSETETETESERSPVSISLAGDLPLAARSTTHALIDSETQFNHFALDSLWQTGKLATWDDRRGRLIFSARLNDQRRQPPKDVVVVLRVRQATQGKNADDSDQHT